jgi:hypothetical protein
VGTLTSPRTPSLAIAVAAVAVAAGMAGAAPLQAVSKDFTVSSSAPKARTVGCFEGDVMSGGFFGDLSGSRVIARTIRLTRTGRVRLRANNISSPSTGEASVHVYCANRFPDLVTRSRSRKLTPRDNAITVRCPGNSDAVWGGFRIPDAGPLPSESRRVHGDWWRVSFSLEGSSQATAFAHCAKLKRRVSSERRTEVLPGGSTGAARARCPRGSKLISGGYRGQHRIAASKTTIVGGSEIAAGKWRAYGQAATVNDSKLTAFAYCLT